MLFIDSQKPVSVTYDGETIVYSKWGVPSVQIVATSDGKFDLIIGFKRYSADGVPMGEAKIKKFVVKDILANQTLAPIAGQFFLEVATLAFLQGVIE